MSHEGWIAFPTIVRRKIKQQRWQKFKVSLDTDKIIPQDYLLETGKTIQKHTAVMRRDKYTAILNCPSCKMEFSISTNNYF